MFEMARTHRLQVVHADGELPQRQQQVQLFAQEGDVAHLQERERHVDTDQVALCGRGLR